MLRKIALVSTLLISTPCFSSSFYLGAGAGPEFASFNQAARISQVGGFDARDSTNLSGTGIFGTLFGGYGWTHNQFYLAGELNANLSSVGFQSSNEEVIRGTYSALHYRIQNSYGLSLLPGYLWKNDTLLYARVGYANGSLKISSSDSSIDNINQRIDGFRYGLGFRQGITKHVSARMEYSHIDYRSESFTVLTSNATTKSTTLTPKTNLVEFGLIYLFD